MTAHDLHWLGKMFTNARSFKAWSERPVPADKIRHLYELMRWAPTSMNCNPARLLFLQSAEAKERLLPALSEGNVAKTRGAPVTVLIGYDEAFFEQLPRLYPGRSVELMRQRSREETTAIAEYNCALQTGYLIMAARAIDLDCGPISGFDRDLVNEEFFNEKWAGTPEGGKVKISLICNLGYGDASGLRQRSARLDFGEACRVM